MRGSPGFSFSNGVFCYLLHCWGQSSQMKRKSSRSSASAGGPKRQSANSSFQRQSRSPAQSNLQQKADISCRTFALRVTVLAYAATVTFALSRMRKPTGAIVNCISSCARPPSGVSKAMMSKSRRVVAIASLISSIAR